MARTPDEFPGTRIESEVILEPNGGPSVSGSMTFDQFAFQFRDHLGVFNPRSGSLPPPIHMGDVLFATGTLEFAPRLPVTNLTTGWIINNDGILIVQG